MLDRFCGEIKSMTSAYYFSQVNKLASFKKAQKNLDLIYVTARLIKHRVRIQKLFLTEVLKTIRF
jgi:hypothetical protein